MSRSMGRAAGAAVAVMLVISGCSERLPRKQVLARLPASWAPAGFAVSDDLRHYAFQERLTGGGVRMIQDGTPGPVYAFLSTRSFAPESDRLFSWATRRADGRRDETLLVAAGTPYPVGMSRHEFLTFPPDGSRWAVVAAVPPTGDEGPPGDRRVFVLVDGHEQGRWSDASVPAFSDDAAHVAWIVAEPAPAGEVHRRLLVDGAPRAEFAGVPGRCVPPLDADVEGAGLPRYERAFYLADGRLVALVRDGDGWALWRAGEVIRRYAVAFPASGAITEVVDDFCPRQPAIAGGSLVAARNAPTMVWWERADGRWRLVRDGERVDDLTCMRFWDLPPPVVSDDGKAWAYPCVTGTSASGDEVFVVTPRGRHGPYEAVWAITLSDDGNRVAYGASVGGDASAPWRVYADGVAYPPRYYSVWRPRFDPTGRHLAWEGLRVPGGRTALAIDGHDLVQVDQLINGPFFLAPGWASWAVRQGHRLARINLPLRARRRALPSESAGG
jgi:hypothetical protein